MDRVGHLIRFAIVGASVAAIYAALYLGLLALGTAQAPANVLAFLIAVAVQYVGQAGFTFGAPLADGGQITRFALMIGLGLATSTLITAWMAPAAGAPDWAAALAVTLLLPVQNYLFMTLWVFANTRPQMDHTS